MLYHMKFISYEVFFTFGVLKKVKGSGVFQRDDLLNINQFPNHCSFFADDFLSRLGG